MTRNFLNDPTPFLHFCNYPPFEEDLDLHLNKPEFSSCKICLYQVWLKLARCFTLKDSFQYTYVKIVSPLVSPILTLGDHNLYKLKSAPCQIWAILGQWFSREKNYNDLAKFSIFMIISPLKRTWPFIWTISNSFDNNLYHGWLKWPADSGEDFFFYINISEYGFPYFTVAPPDPQGPWFEKKTWIYIISESFQVDMTYSGSVILKILKIFKWTHPIFAIISPLKSNLEFSLPKDDLYQGWSKLASLF
jgi:hypothetical protein